MNMNDKTNTPETDKAYLTHKHDDSHRIDNMLATSERLERDLNELRGQLRAVVEARGRYHTQIEMEKLVGLLPSKLNLAHDENLE